MNIIKQVFKRLAEKHKIKKNRIYYCLHCEKEILYEEYQYQGGLCQRCAECSCMG